MAAYLHGAEKSAVSPEPRLENVYRTYTSAYRVEENGVVVLPANLVWDVETSWRGMDLQGNLLPDTRVMLRLRDPNLNYSALTAQMDLATAAKLHHDLGQMIIKKLQNPYYQDRSHVTSGSAKHRQARLVPIEQDGAKTHGERTDEPGNPAKTKSPVDQQND